MKDVALMNAGYGGYYNGGYNYGGYGGYNYGRNYKPWDLNGNGRFDLGGNSFQIHLFT